MSQSTHDGDGFSTMGPDARGYERYTAVLLEGERVIVYDVDQEEAWIEADNAVPVEGVR